MAAMSMGHKDMMMQCMGYICVLESSSIYLASSSYFGHMHSGHSTLKFISFRCKSAVAYEGGGERVDQGLLPSPHDSQTSM